MLNKILITIIFILICIKIFISPENLNNIYIFHLIFLIVLDFILILYVISLFISSLQEKKSYEIQIFIGSIIIFFISIWLLFNVVFLWNSYYENKGMIEINDNSYFEYYNESYWWAFWWYPLEINKNTIIYPWIVYRKNIYYSWNGRKIKSVIRNWNKFTFIIWEEWEKFNYIINN